MDGRPFLTRQGKLGILVDSRSLEVLLADKNETARTILKYSSCQPFEFIRSPLHTDHPELKELPMLIQQYDDKGELITIDIVSDKYESKTGFGYKMHNIEEIGNQIYKKPYLSVEEKETILLVFIQAALNFRNDMRIMTTNNKVLLSNRIWFESHFPVGILNIATLEETKEIMDLFAKYRNKYYISRNRIINKSWWYMCSFFSKVPNYSNKGRDKILYSFASRFKYLLMCIDELGFQYYSGANNDTMETMMYHFNYFISLISGIFDTLAIRTKNQLELKFKGDNDPSKTSLNPKPGKDFLNEVGKKNDELHKHITNHTDLINLIYLLRNRILHREMLDNIRYENTSEKQRWNLFMIDNKMKELITKCCDTPQDYEPLSIWGIQSEWLGNYLLEPYHFVKAATALLIPFCNEYLHLLGFGDSTENTKKHPNNEYLQRLIKMFREDNLGFNY